MPQESPFPGMDPYLEKYWGEVHQRLITYACDQLQTQLPGNLRARMEERVYVEDEIARRRDLYPDVRIVERPALASAKTGQTVALAEEPLIIEIPNEPITEGFIEIIDVGSGNKVVTVIEVLSPDNKRRGKGRQLYRQKQRELRKGKVSLVEIDLLRKGPRVLTLPPGQIPPSHRTTYQVCAVRGWKPLAVEVYRAPLQERLPTIHIPLRKTDPDAALNLQSLIEQAYRNGRYDDIDYRKQPEPPLDGDAAAWSDELLRRKGLR